MNIIKQLQDADGNNIYPIGYAQGGMKMDLLWTNPNPTSNYGANTVSVDLSEYGAVLVTFNYSALASLLCPVDGNKYMVTIGNVSTTSSSPSVPRRRGFTPSTSGIAFETSYISGTTTEAQGACIPYQIFGIKMSYIVPTQVQGLQYIEV